MLTKSSAGLIGRMLRFLSTGQWRLVDDPMFTSARKRAMAGVDILQEMPEKTTVEEPPPPSTTTPTTTPESELRSLFASVQASTTTLWGYIWGR